MGRTVENQSDRVNSRKLVFCGNPWSKKAEKRRSRRSVAKAE